MCESNAYLLKDGKEELVMESVNYVQLAERTVLLRSLFGEENVVSGTLREINLSAHKIVLEPL